MSENIESSLTFTAQEANLIIAFIEAGLKFEPNFNSAQNALVLATKFRNAFPLSAESQKEAA